MAKIGGFVVVLFDVWRFVYKSISKTQFFFYILNQHSKANPRSFYMGHKNNLFLVLMETRPRPRNLRLKNLVFGCRRPNFCYTHGKISLYSAILIILLLIF